MYGRANSLPAMRPGVVFALLAMFAADIEIPARADSACAEQPGQQPAGTHWVFHSDRVNGRGCWTLVDTFGHETGLWGGPATVPEALPGPALPSLPDSPSDDSKGGSAPGTAERSAPQISHTHPRHKPRRNVASRVDKDVRADRKSDDKKDGAKQAAPALMSQEERAQFQEFLRWRELQLLTGAIKPEPPVRPASPVVISREESAEFEEFLRWRERQRAPVR